MWILWDICVLWFLSIFSIDCEYDYIYIYILNTCYTMFGSEWYQSLTAHQHQKGHTVPKHV